MSIRTAVDAEWKGPVHLDRLGRIAGQPGLSKRSGSGSSRDRPAGRAWPRARRQRLERVRMTRSRDSREVERRQVMKRPSGSPALLADSRSSLATGVTLCPAARPVLHDDTPRRPKLPAISASAARRRRAPEVALLERLDLPRLHLGATASIRGVDVVLVEMGGRPDQAVVSRMPWAASFGPPPSSAGPRQGAAEPAHHIVLLHRHQRLGRPAAPARRRGRALHVFMSMSPTETPAARSACRLSAERPWCRRR